MDDHQLGPLRAVRGRDDSPGSSWAQSGCLGALAAMFLAPALGFPIMSRGPNFLAFALSVVVLAVVLILSIRWARPNRAVRVHERGWVLVDGHERTAVARRDVVRVTANDGRLQFERQNDEPLTLRLAKDAAQYVVRDFSRLEAVSADESRPSESLAQPPP